MDKIVSSPKYGLYLNRTFKTLLILGILLALIMLIFALTCIGVNAKNEELTESDINTYVPIIIVAIFANVLWGYFFIRQCIFDKKLKLWKKDFVKIYARVLGGYTDDDILEGVTVSTVLKFRYEGQEHVIRSKTLLSRFGEAKGLQQIGQKVPIYYSPTYDEIVFIKEID